MITTILHPNQFKTGIRVLMRVKRHKDGGGASKAKRYISRSEDEFEDVFKRVKDDLETGERIYGSIDARNEDKAIYEFKRRQLDAEFGGDNCSDFYHHTASQWTTALLQTTSRMTKFFLFDLDGKDWYDEFMAAFTEHCAMCDDVVIRAPKIIHEYYTKSMGSRHVITEPFNASKLPTKIQSVKSTNAMMLWGWKE